MELEPQPAAPAVVAVVVTCDPGSWFEPGLASLASQDYPNLSVLVIDAASRWIRPPGWRRCSRAPYVMRLERRVGFGRAANEVLKQVEGASHLLFCHDDVVLAPDAVRCLLEEAFRSNAGIATPKYVQWDRSGPAARGRGHGRQGRGGPGSGRAGRAGPAAARQRARGASSPREGPRSSATDLFRAVGGFNATIDQFGEDLDLSWRARVAGARVVVVPAARVRHSKRSVGAIRPGWEQPGQPASSRSASRRAPGPHPADLLPLVRPGLDRPAGRLYMLGEAVTRLLQGRPGEAAPPGRVVRSGVASARPGCGGPGAGSNASAGPVTGRSGASRRGATPGCGPSCGNGWTTCGPACPCAGRRTRPAAGPGGGRGRRRPDAEHRRRFHGRRALGQRPRRPAAAEPVRDWQQAALVGAVLLACVLFGSRGPPRPPLAGRRAAAEPVDRVVRLCGDRGGRPGRRAGWG